MLIVRPYNLIGMKNYTIRQAGEEKSSYYFERHVSIHSGYLWSKLEQYGFVALSDDTSHMGESCWASIQQLLNSLIEKNIKHLTFISDSPISQYRNKTIFYLINDFALKHEVIVRWLYLEAGHGKSIPDAIGAIVKKKFDDLISLNPNESYLNAQQLYDGILNNTSLKLFIYQKIGCY
ncbi:unnamed protein product [Rotaria sp. Silwood2]|nr:unnamed protein product [Rotaria sp. Silwood2]CAF4439895.1 unnamed protein product [Rotaria sp. Silwood2]